MKKFCKIYNIDRKQILVVLKEDDPEEDIIEITFQPFESSLISTITVTLNYKATMGREKFELLNIKKVEKIVNETIEQI